jgi:Fur family transcriptional regulator, ferric uptake regulator
MTGEKTHCDASRTLKQAGLAKTSQRMAVLESLIAAVAPLSVREILEGIRGKLKINRVTVYRILASFKEGGIVREVGTGQGIGYFEMACLHNPIHPHFNCRRCGAVLCLPPLTLSQAWDFLARPSTFSIEAVNVQITGICCLCRETINSNAVAFDKAKPS